MVHMGNQLKQQSSDYNIFHDNTQLTKADHAILETLFGSF